MTPHVLVVRLDRPGDVLVCGPAVRAVARHADRVTMLVSPAGRGAAELLPGVDEILVWDCPWISNPPPPVRRGDLLGVVAELSRARIDEALILTSFHQSPPPTAMLLRLAGITAVAAASRDYAGDLLTTRIAEPPDAPEPLRMLTVATAAGYRPDPSASDRLAVRPPLPSPIPGRYLAVHPGGDAPARCYPPEARCEVVRLLTADGHTVAVTGGAQEAALTARVAAAGVAPGTAIDLGGRTSLAQLAGVLASADALAVGNTAPAHLAAAVGTPVLSLFSPVVPAVRWAPHGVDSVVLGDQRAACRGTRARRCPVPGHPCLSGVTPAEVVTSLGALRTRLPTGARGVADG